MENWRQIIQQDPLLRDGKGSVKFLEITIHNKKLCFIFVSFKGTEAILNQNKKDWAEKIYNLKSLKEDDLIFLINNHADFCQDLFIHGIDEAIFISTTTEEEIGIVWQIHYEPDKDMTTEPFPLEEEVLEKTWNALNEWYVFTKKLLT